MEAETSKKILRVMVPHYFSWRKWYLEREPHDGEQCYITIICPTSRSRHLAVVNIKRQETTVSPFFHSFFFSLGDHYCQKEDTLGVSESEGGLGPDTSPTKW